MPVRRPPGWASFGGGLAGAEIKNRKKKKPAGQTWTYPEKSFVPQSGGATTKPQVADPAEAETDRIVTEMLAELGYARDAARREAERTAQNEIRRSQALAQALQQLGMPQLIQGVYQNSGQSLAGMAEGFSQDVQGLASQQAAEQGNILAGTGQEGAIRNEGQNMGDVLYGQHGFIPARGLEQTGAAFASEAALQPGFALQFGNMAASGVMKDFQDEILGKFADDEAMIRSKRPSLLAEARDRQTAAKDAKKKEAYDLYEAGLISQRELGRRLGLKGWKKLPDALAGEESNIKIQEVDGNLVAIDMNTGKVQVVYEGKQERDLKTVQLSDGRDVVIDMQTGKIVQTVGGPKPRDNEIRTNKDGSYTIFDSEGNVIGRAKGSGSQYKPEPTKTLWEAAGFKTRKEMWAAARNKARETQGGGLDKYGRPKDEDNPKLSASEAYDKLIGDGIPHNVAVSVLRKYYPKAKFPKGEPASGGAGYSGKMLVPGTSWSGTHITDGLDWNHGQKTAVDIMAAAGTPVGAPESGTVIRHGSAQGGQALYFRADSGRLYWLGHIDGMVAVGTRVRKGQRIAFISADHPAPHLHIDYKIGGGA